MEKWNKDESQNIFSVKNITRLSNTKLDSFCLREITISYISN